MEHPLSMEVQLGISDIYQPLSTIINHYQPLSTIINHYQPLSTIINHYQPLNPSYISYDFAK